MTPADGSDGPERDQEPEEVGPAQDLGALLAQLEAMSDELDEASRATAETIVEGSSAGRAVVIQLTGEPEAVSVHIDPSLVDPADVSMLEDAVLAALRDGLAQVAELREELVEEAEGAEMELGALLNQLGGLANFGGLGLGNLEDLSNPEDLMAGLTGALGRITGTGSGDAGAIPGSLGDLLAGLGLGETPRGGGQPVGSGQAPGAGDETGGAEGQPDASGDDSPAGGGSQDSE